MQSGMQIEEYNSVVASRSMCAIERIDRERIWIFQNEKFARENRRIWFRVSLSEIFFTVETIVNFVSLFFLFFRFFLSMYRYTSNWIDINCPLLSIYVCQTPWMLGNPKTHGVDVNVNWHLASIYRASTKHQHRKLGLILIDLKRDILQSRLRVLYKIAHSIRYQSLNFANKFCVKSPPLMNFTRSSRFTSRCFRLFLKNFPYVSRKAWIFIPFPCWKVVTSRNIIIQEFIYLRVLNKQPRTLSDKW